ncbi:hypothetical protein Athai_62340 [Actinocatenispora thailandica]|uniref:DUF429 domain-containing protein n=1 Tax=Actinocatenispora thailandica TaxID=227318 RepID=A0A7R7DVR7_9ACTN|nr:hypothetical protein [Actinocatenispora thailandica]BCJ38731.1 hypothetical protein Athai_62340 [Actinocatenispora thailandica]
MTMHKVRVVAVDVGSVARLNDSRFGWVARDCRFDGGSVEHIDKVGCGRRPDELPEIIDSALRDGGLVALGMECPLLLPVPADWRDLGRARVGDASHAWSASAGACSMATGLVQLAWLLHEVARRGGEMGATTRPDRWCTAAPLLLWEAFVSGTAKTDRSSRGHIADAGAAVQAFLMRIDRLTVADADDVHLGGHRGLNLAAVAALHAGLCIPRDELDAPLPVVCATATPPSAS